MKHLLIAAMLAFTTASLAAPTLMDQAKAAKAPKPAPVAAPATTPAPAPAVAAAPALAPKPAAPSSLPPACIERLRAHAEQMKKELGLTDAQAAALRNEMERFHGQLLTARADHQSAVAKVLTPEQFAKVEGKHAARRQKMMERCEDGDDMGDAEHHDEGKHKGKNKH